MKVTRSFVLSVILLTALPRDARSATLDVPDLFVATGNPSARAVGQPRSVVVNDAALAALAHHDGGAVLHDVPLPNGALVTFDVERFDVLAPGGRIVATDGVTTEPIVPTEFGLFRGHARDDAAMTITVAAGVQIGVLALVRNDTTLLASIGPSDTSPSGYEILDTIDGMTGDHRGFCDGAPTPPPSPTSPPTRTRSERDAQGPLAADVIVDVGNALVRHFQNDYGQAAAYVMTLMGAVSSLYQRDVDVFVRVSELNVWTTVEPFDGADTSSQLSAYTSYGTSHRSQDARALSEYVNYNPALGGLQYLGTLCSTTYGYGVTNLNGYFSAQGYSWDVNVIAHEMGHGFGSPHTHCYDPPIDHCYNAEPAPSCYHGPVEPIVGETMSYCHLVKSVQLGFGARVSAVIRAGAEAAACVAPRVAFCGDGIIDAGEQCDAGVGNGDFSFSCCSASCTFRPASDVCRPPAFSCDEAEHCSGASAQCPLDAFQSPGTSCEDDTDLTTFDVCDGFPPQCTHPPNPGAIAKAQACRKAVAGAGAKLFKKAIQLVNACESAAIRAGVADQCTTRVAIDPKDQLSRAEAGLRATVGKKCPPPNAARVLYPDEDIAAAVAAAADAQTTTAAVALAPVSPIGSDKLRKKCHAAVRRVRGKIVSASLAASIKCQQSSDKQSGSIANRDECEMTPPDVSLRASTALSKACPGSTAADVMGCGGLPDCVVDAVGDAARDFVHALYGNH